MLRLVRKGHGSRVAAPRPMGPPAHTHHHLASGARHCTQGDASESSSRTPAGLFSLTQTFGRAANPGTRQPWFHATTNDWWVSDVKSPAYNTHQTCAPGKCPFNEAAGEDLGQAGAVYDYAMVIDYNRRPVHPGAGSAFFLHVTNGRPTAGCVATDRAAVIAILRWLDPGQHPLISLGVR